MFPKTNTVAHYFVEICGFAICGLVHLRNILDLQQWNEPKNLRIWDLRIFQKKFACTPTARTTLLNLMKKVLRNGCKFIRICSNYLRDVLWVMLNLVTSTHIYIYLGKYDIFSYWIFYLPLYLEILTYDLCVMYCMIDTFFAIN